MRGEPTLPIRIVPAATVNPPAGRESRPAHAAGRTARHGDATSVPVCRVRTGTFGRFVRLASDAHAWGPAVVPAEGAIGYPASTAAKHEQSTEDESHGQAPIGASAIACAMLVLAGFGPAAPVQAASIWRQNLYQSAGFMYQDPNYTACTAASAMMMLNFTALAGTGGNGFARERQPDIRERRSDREPRLGPRVRATIRHAGIPGCRI